MSFHPLFKSERVELVPQTPEDRELFARWSYDADYMRNLDDDPIRPMTAEAFAEWVGTTPKPDGSYQAFMIATRPEGKRIGFINLFDIKYPNANATFAIGIGEAEYRSKGYGSEAIGLLLDYAFEELGMARVSLRVLSYNTVAMSAYEKIGFVREGTIRSATWRGGQRHDVHCYGILRDEWLAKRQR